MMTDNTRVGKDLEKARLQRRIKKGSLIGNPEDTRTNGVRGNADDEDARVYSTRDGTTHSCVAVLRHLKNVVKQASFFRAGGFRT